MTKHAVSIAAWVIGTAHSAVAQPIAILLSAEPPNAASPSRHVLSVVVENRSGAAIATRGIGIVRLVGQAGEFWAPFDFERIGPIPRNVESGLRLKRREKRSIRIDLATLEWGKTTAALWPFEGLAVAVPGGPYEAVVSVEQRSGPGVDSNTVQLTFVGLPMR